MTKRVMVGMSGGVDSSVTAYVLKQQGYEVIGATMRLHGSDLPGRDAHSCASRACCSLDDVEDAKSVARRLGIAHRTIDFTDRFEDAVIKPFVRAYETARTPNPCVDCNRRLKFGSMLERALDLGCDYVATGHYAQIVRRGDRFALVRGADESKDQSYVLYSLTQRQLAHTLLPLGSMRKSEVRAIAAEQGFINADKPESQDICFIPDGDYVGFLERYSGHTPQPGVIRDEAGAVIGRHSGIESFTVGQRKGIGIAASEPLYVVAKDARDRALVVGPKDSLLSDGCVADDWNWIADPEDLASFEVMVKTHYRQTPHPARVERRQDGTVRIVYASPARLAAPGQAVVAYQGDEVVGGGTVVSTF